MKSYQSALVVFAFAVLGVFIAWARLSFEADLTGGSNLVIVEGPPKHLVTPEMLEATGKMTKQPAPAFLAEATDGKTYRLEDVTSSKPLVLTFIKDGCPCSEAAQPFFNDSSRPTKMRSVSSASSMPRSPERGGGRRKTPSHSRSSPTRSRASSTPTRPKARLMSLSSRRRERSKCYAGLLGPDAEKRGRAARAPGRRRYEANRHDGCTREVDDGLSLLTTRESSISRFVASSCRHRDRGNCGSYPRLTLMKLLSEEGSGQIG